MKNRIILIGLILGVVSLYLFNACATNEKAFKPFVPVNVFDLEMKIPDTAYKLPDTHLSTIKYYDPDSRINWYVERRGNGLLSESYLPLSTLANMVASAIGVKGKIPTVPIKMGGQQAEKISFTVADRSFIAFIFIHSGYVYNIGLFATTPYSINLSKYADHLTQSIEFPQAKPMISVSKKISSLADLKIEFPDDPALFISPVIGQDAISILNPDRRLALIVTRNQNSWEGPDPSVEQVKDIFVQQGHDVKEAKKIIIDNVIGWQLEFYKVSPNGDRNLFLVHIIKKGDYLYSFNAVSDANNRKELIIFAKDTLGKINFR